MKNYTMQYSSTVEHDRSANVVSFLAFDTVGKGDCVYCSKENFKLLDVGC